MTTWEELEAGLADVLGRLPEGAVLQVGPAVPPEEAGYHAHLWQDADRLYAEVPGDWSATLDWPAPAAGHRRLAGHLVAELREVFDTPDDLAYRCWLADTGRDHPLPQLGLDPLDIAYYARPGAGGTVDRPAELLRRIRIGWRIVDEALDRAGTWRPTEALNQAELGELGEDLVRVEHARAARILTGLRRLAAGAPADGTLRWTAVKRDDAGRPTASGRPRLDGFERSAVAGYLRGAPVVIAAFGFDEDPLDPERPEVVPLTIRTDGHWVWPESEGYFAERYGIPPEPELLAHIQRQGYRWPEVDDETLIRAARLVRG
jgi:hypothetical protein